VLTQIHQLDLGVHHPGRRRRAHHLPAVGNGHKPRGAVHRRPEVVPVADLGLAGVQAHGDPDRRRRRPRFTLDELLGRQRRPSRRRRGAKRDGDPVPTVENTITPCSATPGHVTIKPPIRDRYNMPV